MRFEKGHPGRGGRPKGTKNGAGRNAWRAAAKRAADIARRIDVVQSALLDSPTLSTDQGVRLLELVRTRLKHYEARSEYRRELIRSGRLQIVYPYGVTYDRSTGTFTRNNEAQSTPRKRRPTSLMDTGARKALRMLRPLDKVVQILLERVSKAELTIASRSADASVQLRTLAALIKAEAEALTRSRDPRPLKIYRPFRIVFSHIPYDPADRDPDKPLRGSLRDLGTPSKIWTKDELRADLEQRKRFYLNLGQELPDWLQHVAARCEQDRGDRGATGCADTSSRSASSKANPKPMSDRKESARAETSPRTKSSKAAPLTAPRPTATAPEDAEAEKILENFSLEEDRPSECLRCRGRGYFAGPRVCRDCEGTTYTFKDDGTRSRCTRCKGKGHVLVRLGDCPDCNGTGYSYVPDDYPA